MLERESSLTMELLLELPEDVDPEALTSGTPYTLTVFN